MRAAGVELRVDVDPAPAAQPTAAVQLAVYRILQEALTNALRHGDGGAVAVRLSGCPRCARGSPASSSRCATGCEPGDRPSESGHGMIGMGERASLVGGWLSAGDSDGAFVVSGVLPTGVPA